jgi:hypothetical protein
MAKRGKKRCFAKIEQLRKYVNHEAEIADQSGREIMLGELRVTLPSGELTVDDLLLAIARAASDVRFLSGIGPLAKDMKEPPDGAARPAMK